MAAYMIVNIRLTGSSWVKGYIENVPPILRSFGGEYYAVSKTVKVLEGEGDVPHQIAIFTFPSIARMEEFMACEAYRPWKEARLAESAADIWGFETE